MAKILLQAPLAGIRGKLGGSVYSANMAGPYIKVLSSRPTPQSAAHSIIQAQLGGQGDVWAGLAQALRDDWDTWAALPAQEQTDSLGQAYYLSGYIWFSKINLWLYNTGRTARTAVPVAGPAAAPTIQAFFLHTWQGPPDQTRIIYAPAHFAGQDMVICAAQSSSQGRAVPVSSYIPIFWRQVPGNTQQVFRVPWRYAFGDPMIGHRGFITVHKQNSSGYRSLGTTLRADCAS